MRWKNISIESSEEKRGERGDVCFLRGVSKD
jgi:hypothetical protein